MFYLIGSFTFRESALRYLSSKVCTLLACVIAFLDRNWNLDLLMGKADEGATPKAWLSELWIDLMGNPQGLQISYADTIVHSCSTTDAQGREVRSVQVVTDGYEARGFKVKFPFSWVIKEKIEELRKCYQDNSKSALRKVACITIV